MFAVAALCQRRNFVGHRPTLQARHGLNRLFERFHPFPPNCHFLSTGSSRGRSDPVFDRFSIINGRPRLFPTKLPPFPAFRRASRIVLRPFSRSNSPRSRSSSPFPDEFSAVPHGSAPLSRFVRRLSRSVRHGSRTLRQRSRCKFLEQMLLHFTSRMGLFIILTFPAIETRGRG